MNYHFVFQHFTNFSDLPERASGVESRQHFTSDYIWLTNPSPKLVTNITGFSANVVISPRLPYTSSGFPQVITDKSHNIRRLRSGLKLLLEFMQLREFTWIHEGRPGEQVVLQPVRNLSPEGRLQGLKAGVEHVLVRRDVHVERQLHQRVHRGAVERVGNKLRQSGIVAVLT